MTGVERAYEILDVLQGGRCRLRDSRIIDYLSGRDKGRYPPHGMVRRCMKTTSSPESSSSSPSVRKKRAKRETPLVETVAKTAAISPTRDYSDISFEEVRTPVEITLSSDDSLPEISTSPSITSQLKRSPSESKLYSENHSIIDQKRASSLPPVLSTDSNT